MTEPTDTNQASEDELDEQIRLLLQDAMGDFPTEHLLEYHTNNFKQAIQAIIRTEKLKLLAEVRERVVGEDQPDIGDSSHERNILRREERTALNKLEAEL